MGDRDDPDLAVTSQSTPTADDVYRLLQTASRRFVLYYLLAHERVDLEELTDVTTAWHAVAAGRVGTPTDHELRFLSLVHNDLPELAEAGLLSFDGQAVSRKRHPAQIQQIIEHSLAYETSADPTEQTEPMFVVEGEESDEHTRHHERSLEPTSLSDAIDTISDRRISVTVYTTAAASAFVTAVRESFASKNATVNHRELPGENELAFLTIGDTDGFRGALSARRFHAFLSPPIYRPWDDEFVHAGYRALFDLIDETLFTSMDRRQLLAASREIEDRAWRVGSGQLRVCFQSVPKLRAQIPLFKRLHEETDLEIHCYAPEAFDPPELEGIRIHNSPAPEVSRHWALVFDGDGQDGYKCAMVSREVEADAFEGFWTYDPVMVDELTAYLSTTYE